jgi:hypothetical protein
MRRPQRLIAAAVLIALSCALTGCGSSFGSGFDPSDLLDWLDTKKKLPGERKPVFPEGVPGLEQGVPKDLYKGAQQQQDVPPVAEQPLPPAPTKQAKGKGRPPAAAPAAEQAAAPAEPDGETAATEQPSTPPQPKPKKIVRKRTTAPPPDPNTPPPQAARPAQPAAQSAQQAPSPFPAPLPGGTFTR